MDLPAFALHAEPLRRKSYRPKPVLAHSFTQSSFGGNFVSSEQALARLVFATGLFLARISFAASEP